MKLEPFKLEEFWKNYEFTSPYILCASDAETWSLKEILEMADPESKKLWDNLSFGYTETQGLPLLREEIARLYSSIQSDQIFTTAGAEEGIYCTMKTLLSPKDHVVVVTPCYQSLITLPKSLGAEVTEVSLSLENGWKLRVSDLRKAFRENTKLLIINYPHNPTGTVLDRETFEGMIDLARETGAYIFSDEMYRFFEIEQEPMPSIADAYEKGIALFGMTKPFGLAGLRIGWLASKDASFMDGVMAYKHYTSICNSAPSEILSVAALRAKEKILERNRKITLDNLALLDAFFERQSSKVSWVRPESGPIALVKLHLPVSVEQFIEELVEKTGILIMPGSVFDLPGNYFRIGFARKNMGQVLGLFEEFLGEYATAH